MVQKRAIISLIPVFEGLTNSTIYPLSLFWVFKSNLLTLKRRRQGSYSHVLDNKRPTWTPRVKTTGRTMDFKNWGHMKFSLQQFCQRIFSNIHHIHKTFYNFFTFSYVITLLRENGGNSQWRLNQIFKLKILQRKISRK